MRSLVPSIYPISSFGSSPLVIEFRNTDIASRTLVFPLPFFPVNIICLHLFSQTGISKFFKWRTLLILIFFIRKPRGQGRWSFYWVRRLFLCPCWCPTHVSVHGSTNVYGKVLRWMAFTKAQTSAAQPPVWERAYAVSKTKKCVEGAAETRGADETITEGLFVTLPVNSNLLIVSIR